MRKGLLRIIVLMLISDLWLATLAFGQIWQQDSSRRADNQESLLRLRTGIVNLTVTVTDRRNTAIPGLGPDHFQVYEDNVPQQIEYFHCEDEPLSIGIIFDLSGSMKKKLPQAREAVKNFMQACHRDDDFFLLGFNRHSAVMADFSDASSITDRLAAAGAEGRTALYDAVYLGIEKIRSGRLAKHALVIVSDGVDNASRFGMGKLSRQLKEENILVYCLGYGIWPGEDYGYAHKTLEDLAKMTGGRAFFPNSAAELEEAVSTIALELRRQYSLAYIARSGDREGQWRKIKVRVSPPAVGLKLHVRAREGYYSMAGAER